MAGLMILGTFGTRSKLGHPEVMETIGGADRDRTGGLLVANEALSAYTSLQSQYLTKSWSKFLVH